MFQFGPAIPLLGLYPKNPETPFQKNLCTPMFIAAQFTIAKYWKKPKCPSANEWIKKLWYIYTIEFYAAERKKELIPFIYILESVCLSLPKILLGYWYTDWNYVKLLNQFFKELWISDYIKPLCQWTSMPLH